MSINKQDHVYPIGLGHRPTLKCPACIPEIESGTVEGQQFAIHQGSGPRVNQVGYFIKGEIHELKKGTIATGRNSGNFRRGAHKRK